jgi:hypothetical protein
MARRSEIILFSYRTLCSDEDYLATPSEGVITGKIIVEVLMAPITEYRGSESSEIELQDKYDKSRSTLKGGRCMNKYGDILHHHHHLRRGEITTDKVVFISPITPPSLLRPLGPKPLSTGSTPSPQTRSLLPSSPSHRAQE